MASTEQQPKHICTHFGVIVTCSSMDSETTVWHIIYVSPFFDGGGVYLVIFGIVGAGVYNFQTPGVRVYFILVTPHPW